MSISASQIVKINPRVINAGANELETVGLILTENKLCPFPKTLTFSSASAVGDYFGLFSKEYQMAVKYFLGYNNSFKKPRKLNFGRYVKSAISACFIGSGTTDVKKLQTVMDGECKLRINGAEVEVTGLDFTGITTQSEAAVILESKLTGVQVAYNSDLKTLVLHTTQKDENASIEIVSDGEGEKKCLEYLGIAGGSGWNGSLALEPSVNMAMIIELNQNWVSFTTLEEIETSEIIKFAEWVNGTESEYLYCPYTSKKSDISPLDDNNLPKKLKENNYEGVIVSYGGTDLAVLVMSIGACIDWERNNGLVTYAFKSQEGMGATINNNTDAENAKSLNVNFYGNYATRNDEFLWYYQGSMSGGKFGFVDAFIGQLWLRNVLQVAIMNGLGQAGRVPYTDEGYTMIRAWCMDPINRALVNGVIDPGVAMSEAQKAQLFSEIGEDVSDEIFLKGYYLQILDPSAAVRAVRGTPVIGIWYTYGGSVHYVEIPVTAVL